LITLRLKLRRPPKSTRLPYTTLFRSELNHLKTKNQSDVGKEKFTLELFSILERQYPEEENIHILGGDLYLTLGKKPEAQKQYLRSEEHTSELQSRENLVCRLLLEQKK